MTKQRAKQAASAVKKGAHTAKKSKVWNKVTFKLPKTLSKARTPIAIKKAPKEHTSFGQTPNHDVSCNHILRDLGAVVAGCCPCSWPLDKANPSERWRQPFGHGECAGERQ